MGRLKNSGICRRGLTMPDFPLLLCAFLLLSGLSAPAALPPKPARYVEDRAGILSPAAEASLNAKLEQFERDTSNQVIVATFPEVPADYQMEDFTQRTAEAWGVGQKKEDNGAVLFLFPGSRKLRIEVGYGLEGAIPDGVAKRIIEREIVPAFRAGDFDGGVTRGVDAILAAARGEYSGSGRTVADAAPAQAEGIPLVVVIFFIVLLLVILGNAVSGRGASYGPSGRRNVLFPDSFIGGSRFGGGSSRGSSGGGFGGGGGGGFSGGGGS
ncbi:MAG: TPM domain-containing protein, partial [Terrimicrobiaceae bacterium]